MEIKFGKPRPSATEIKNISDVTAKQQELMTKKICR